MQECLCSAARPREEKGSFVFSFKINHSFFCAQVYGSSNEEKTCISKLMGRIRMKAILFIFKKGIVLSKDG